MNSKIDRLTVVSLCFLWLALCVFAWISRPLMPIDETRYISVAWEMWQSNNFLVPHLNGAPYSHKPPLLFWLVNAGWWLFGVNAWWPRLVPPLFGLGSLFLTYRISLVLWPRKEDSAFISSHLLLANILWALFSTVVMFDMLIVFFHTVRSPRVIVYPPL